MCEELESEELTITRRVMRTILKIVGHGGRHDFTGIKVLSSQPMDDDFLRLVKQMAYHLPELQDRGDQLHQLIIRPCTGTWSFVLSRRCATKMGPMREPGML